MKILYTTLLASALAVCCSAQQTVGLFQQDTSSESGYVLFGSMFGKKTYLIDKCGKSINNWTSDYTAGFSAYLLPDGSLLRPGSDGNINFLAAGAGGIIERQSWNGSMLWSYSLSSRFECQHHDICAMPNGNVLAVVWELHDAGDAIGNGRDTATLSPRGIWSEKIVELQPVGTNAAIPVWEWHVWDHLVQDRDPTGPGFGMVSSHPELIDINYIGHNNPKSPDWLHINTVSYNAKLDQIMLSSYYFDEVWIIDHSTTTTEAGGHSGGQHHKGGDLIYRWGNPEAYRLGGPADHQLFSPHDPQWIPDGYPGAGQITIFNNGAGRPDGSYSTVVQIATPIDDSSHYISMPSMPYGPQNPSWVYKAPNPTDFYSSIISGAQRLQGGHTLITEGTKGNLFEVDMAGRILWRYVSPAEGSGLTVQGSAPVQNSVFRAIHYAPNYPAFNGRTLTPGAPLETSPLVYNCYFAPIVTPTSVHGQTAAKGAEVVNPIQGNELRIRPDADLGGARIMLLDALGRRSAEWTADLQQGTWLSLPLEASLASGHYTLHITAQNGARSSIAVIK